MRVEARHKRKGEPWSQWVPCEAHAPGAVQAAFTTHSGHSEDVLATKLTVEHRSGMTTQYRPVTS